MPSEAAHDMIEWLPNVTAEQIFASILRQKTSIDRIIALAPDAPPLQDDRPMNEYFLLRSVAPNIWKN
jgi:hypothetical protein